MSEKLASLVAERDQVYSESQRLLDSWLCRLVTYRWEDKFVKLCGRFEELTDEINEGSEKVAQVVMENEDRKIVTGMACWPVLSKLFGLDGIERVQAATIHISCRDVVTIELTVLPTLTQDIIDQPDGVKKQFEVVEIPQDDEITDTESHQCQNPPKGIQEIRDEDVRF
jgi:hypothetical protein